MNQQENPISELEPNLVTLTTETAVQDWEHQPFNLVRLSENPNMARDLDEPQEKSKNACEQLCTGDSKSPWPWTLKKTTKP